MSMSEIRPNGVFAGPFASNDPIAYRRRRPETTHLIAALNARGGADTKSAPFSIEAAERPGRM